MNLFTRRINLFMIFPILTMLVFASCKEKQPLVLSGSETMHEMMIQVSHEFEKENPYLVTVNGGGSQKGIDDLKAKLTDIALVSRELKEDERQILDRENNLEQVIVAYDGAAIVVNPENKVSEITLEQTSDIFSGKIKNWKEVNGEDLPIEVIIRNDKSGTAAFFKEHVLQKKDLGASQFNSSIEYSKDAIQIKDNYELIEKVTTKKGSISYIGMGWVNNSKGKIKALSYGRTADAEKIAPSVENIIKRKYRLARGLYLVYKNIGGKQGISDFVSFVTSEKGQKAIQTSGYLRSTLPEVEVKP